MTREDIIRMAREAFGAPYSSYLEKRSWDINDKQVERFAALVAAAEREACAKVAEKTVCDTHVPTGIKIFGTRAADAIRKRGEQ